MPEIPDIEAYLEALQRRVVGRTLRGIRLASPFVLRTVDPLPEAVTGGCVRGVERLGKRIVVEVVPEKVGTGATGSTEPGGRTPAISAPSVNGSGGSRSNDTPISASIFLVIHLMIAGRLHWREPGAAIPKKAGLAAFDFTDGTLLVTEAGTRRRASLHLVRGRERLAALDRGGLDLFTSDTAGFRSALSRKNQTLKRALTDPSVIDGLGNAYSDEILHRARLSPFKQTRSLDDAEIRRLLDAAVEVLTEWTERLRVEAKQAFPEKVTAFRPEMAVHGRFRSPCPVCGTPIERIVYSEKEWNYCPGCQTEGRILADRALSRLLKDDWPESAR